MGLGYGYAEQITDPVYYGLFTALLSFMRVVEGAIDRHWKRTQNNIHPRPPAGASPPDPPSGIPHA